MINKLLKLLKTKKTSNQKLNKKRGVSRQIKNNSNSRIAELATREDYVNYVRKTR